jgi:hypothetical protein
MKNEYYVYQIKVDGIIRYFGKGKGKRAWSHLKDAQVTNLRCGEDTDHLSPHFHKMLVQSIRKNLKIEVKILLENLTIKNAYQIEHVKIGESHKANPGQLWNTIDERFLEKKYIPDSNDWEPINPLYKLPRPVSNSWVPCRAPTRRDIDNWFKRVQNKRWEEYKKNNPGATKGKIGTLGFHETFDLD